MRVVRGARRELEEVAGAFVQAATSHLTSQIRAVGAFMRGRGGRGGGGRSGGPVGSSHMNARTHTLSQLTPHLGYAGVLMLLPHCAVCNVCIRVLRWCVCCGLCFVVCVLWRVFCGVCIMACVLWCVYYGMCIVLCCAAVLL